ncbi:MAG: LpxI family protein, partial [Alphaproteobacteria bacterium]|nr:LpxI family protein [Alphaproteobacteria bacterium]
ESIEGTDALITRAHDVRREGGGGVLVKIAKPQQDNRYDLPAIGPETVARVHAAGLAGIAVEAGRSLIIDRAATLDAADMAGLFIVGIKAGGEGHG